MSRADEEGAPSRGVKRAAEDASPGPTTDQGLDFETKHYMQVWHRTRTALRRIPVQMSTGDDHNVWHVGPRMIHQPQMWLQQAKEAGYMDSDTLQTRGAVMIPRQEGRGHRLAELRSQIWLQTEHCMKVRGYDLPSGEWISLKLGGNTARDTSKLSLYTWGTLTRNGLRYRIRLDTDLGRPALPNDVTCNVRVEKEDCLTLAEVHTLAGESVAVLNMANARHPGGGFRSGAGAQEENIHRRSDLYRYLGCMRNGLYPLKTGEAITSTGVTVFRGPEKAGYPFLKHPFQVTMISCAAINRPSLAIKGQVVDGEFEMDDDAEDDTRVRIKAILYAAEKCNCDTLILSAFGCGAFRCPPTHMAWLFRQELLAHKMILSRKSIIFAILDDHNANMDHNPNGNFQPFWDTLRDIAHHQASFPNYYPVKYSQYEDDRYYVSKRTHSGQTDRASRVYADRASGAASERLCGPEEYEAIRANLAERAAGTYVSSRYDRERSRTANFYRQAMQIGGLHKMLRSDFRDMHKTWTHYKDGEDMYKAWLRDKRLDRDDMLKQTVAQDPTLLPRPEERSGGATAGDQVAGPIELCAVCGKYPRNPESYDDKNGVVKGPVCCNKCRETNGRQHGKRCTQFMERFAQA